MRPHALLLLAPAAAAWLPARSLPRAPVPQMSAAARYDVDVRTADGEWHTLRGLDESTSVLAAAEAAGLLPGSDCRRGRCFSCAARVLSGAAFSLRVKDSTALCREAHDSDLVLLCSAYACGPGLALEMDNVRREPRLERDLHVTPLTSACDPRRRRAQDWRAQDIQYRRRFVEPSAFSSTHKNRAHFVRDDVERHLERSRVADTRDDPLRAR